MDIFEEFTDTLAVTSFDPNESRATATPITNGQYEIQGNAMDWYRFDLSAGEMSSFTMNQQGEARDLSMVLFDELGRARAADAQANGTESFDFLAGEDGTYYLRITPAQYASANAPEPPADLQMTYTLDANLPDPSVTDGNDVRANARDLDAGSYSIEGSAVDWFRVTSMSGEMTVNLRADADAMPQDLNVVIYNAAGNAVAAGQGPTGVENVVYTMPTDGEYFIKVFWAGAPDATSGGIKLDYTLDITLPQADVRQADDTPEGAATLAQGTTTFNGSNVDWHRLESLSGQVTLELRSGPEVPGKFDDLDMVLYAENGTTVFEASIAPGTGVENISYVLPEDGVYFLKVFAHGFPDGAPNGSRLSYQLNVDLPEAQVRGADDPGETRETATLLTSGTQQVRGSGQDWFQIVTGPGELNFAMTSTGGQDATSVSELNMVLYDANGEQVQANNTNGGTERITWLVNETGTYYLRVFAPAYSNETTPNGVAMNYTLTADLPQNTWSQQLDFGPVRFASVSAYDIDNDGRDEIFVGTSKSLDAEGNELRPAGLIVLEDDGTVKWEKTFAAIDGPDSRTGKTYNTTSVSTQPIFSDLDGDGRIDIIVGVGGDNAVEFDAPGQPGDKGGVYALSVAEDGASLEEMWFFQTKDIFGTALDKAEDGPDGRSEGVYGTPRVFDIDADGKREVMFTSWDHRFYAVDGATGALELEFNLHDTTSTSPGIADLDGDGLYELVLPADITDNEAAGINTQGGILHVLSNYAQANIDGWTDQVQNSTSAEFRGKFSEQPLWSSPKIADIDRDGSLEIILGTSNFFQDERGQHIKVWNADGTLQYTLETNGQTLAAPVLADLDGNGTLEIIATTIKGSVYAWSANGQLIFEAEPAIFKDGPLTGTARELPIARQPVIVDIDNADNDLEILISMGSQTVVLDSDGTQLSSLTRPDQVFNTYAGAPVVKDIDGDGRLDIISGGTTQAQDQAVIYRWENFAGDVVADTYRTAEYQNSQSLHDVREFVERFYQTILGRSSDAVGGNYWVDNLATGVLAGENIANGFINSREFQNRNTTDAEYVNTLYSAFFNRAADEGGFNAWIQQLADGADRSTVLDGFTGSREFANLSESFGIRPEAAFGAASGAATITGDATDADILRGTAANQNLTDEGTVLDPDSRDHIERTGQIYRMYGAAFDRAPNADGYEGWFNAMNAGTHDIERVASGFVNSVEFQRTYGALEDVEFIELLYQNVLGRASDAGGRQGWSDFLENGGTREQVIVGFSDSGEFRRNTQDGLDTFMRKARIEWNDVIEGGAGNDQMNGGIGSDTFVFRAGQGGSDTIHGFEPWDQLQLSGFGFDAQSDAIARMTQQGTDVVFNHAGQRIVFEDFTLAEMNRVRFNI
ncbi:DUF4214 domain-containing protein [uncultured Sulfitobacter sp.]|uniref:DUF4214 domain-containing protein n=1 Tax=uncultured Sulfitobacter sp. TaxID=191468 RepID=UPI00260BC3D1|nr:DUF4214 domain-containing protein [uncultured Sulfitobacter sp.]